jgi:hypothetical protein
MKNVSDKICKENQNTLLCSKTYFHAVYEIIWKNMIRTARQATDENMACVHFTLDA